MGNCFCCSRMQSLFILAPIFSLFVTAGMTDEAPSYSCPEIDVNFFGNDIARILSVTDWHSCGQICKLDPDCKFWTHSILEDACFLKNSDKGLAYGEHRVSGVRGCE